MAVGGLAWLTYAAHIASGVGGRSADIVLLDASGGAAALACAAANRSRARITWLLLGVAIVAYGTTSVCYAAVPDAAKRFPSIYDVGLFMFYPLVTGGLVQFVRSQIVAFSNLLWIDCCALALAAMALGAAAIDVHGNSLVVFGQLAYLLGDLAFLGLIGSIWLLSGLRRNKSMALLAGAASTLAVADAIYATKVSEGVIAPGLLSLLLWPAAMLIMAAAARPRIEAVPLATRLWSKVAVPVVSAFVFAPIGFLSALPEPATVIAGVGIVVVLVRVVVSLAENERLLETTQQAAITDPLTGLANRALLLDRLGHALARKARRGSGLALLFIDLDDFKAVNDSLGHELGDRLLLAVGERLSAALRGEDTLARAYAPSAAADSSHDTIARLGGDEFVVLLEGLRDPQDSALVANRLLDSLRAPLMLDEHELLLDASIGITLSDGDERREPIDFLRDADTAMYAAKRAGRGGYQIFEHEMHLQVLARTALARDLRSAVSDRQLRLLYQPQVDLLTARMSGVEALVRWQHPARGLLAPDAFIPAAERTGMIVAIDDWVLREACTQMRAWDRAGLPPVSVGVNVSAARLTSSDFAQVVADVLHQTGADPTRLEIELTETVAVEHDSDAIRRVRRIRDFGVKVAIDDFGMGHSALSRLQSFPVDRLKIDRSFVAPLTHSGAAHNSIAAAMIAMAHSLGLLVVAEGIETAAHVAALKALGCEYGQGYFFDRPVPAEEIARLAREQAVMHEPERNVVQDAPTGKPNASEAFIRVLLAELQRLTGLDSTYLTSIDLTTARQRITHSRNTGMLDIPEGLSVDWADTVCRRALEQGVGYTDDVPGTFPDSPAGAGLGLQTYITVPVTGVDGDVRGTLCGASRNRVSLGPDALRVMEGFASLIAQMSYGDRQAPPASIATRS